MSAKTIEIKTTQNVTITYELASVGLRMAAFFLDAIIKFAAVFLILLIWELLPYEFRNNTEEFFLYLFYLPIIFFSWLVMESTMNGQTLGKKLVKIKVVKLNGKQPDFYDYLLRWCFRMVDGYLTFYLPGVILIASTDYAQRLGDKVSNTAVVRIKDTISISLADVLRIDTKQNYEPVYPAMRNFPEEDVLLIKEALERFQKHRNKKTATAVETMAKRFTEKLELEQIPHDRILFLKTIMKDYIVLTR